MVGFELIQQIGGGGFSRVFRAVNLESHEVAACKLVLIKEQTTKKERQALDREMQLHAALKHQNVLEFLHAAIVEPKHKRQYVPGVYMLLELAAGGDLFDKIGAIFVDPLSIQSLTCGSSMISARSRSWGGRGTLLLLPAPGGDGETLTLIICIQGRRIFHHRTISIAKVSAIVT